MSTLHGSPVDGDLPDPSTMTYADATRELDEIVAFFEGEDVDVDQIVVRLRRATALVEELDRRIGGTRLQVEELVSRLAAASGAGREDDGGGDGPEATHAPA